MCILLCSDRVRLQVGAGLQTRSRELNRFTKGVLVRSHKGKRCHYNKTLRGGSQRRCIKARLEQSEPGLKCFIKSELMRSDKVTSGLFIY